LSNLCKTTLCSTVQKTVSSVAAACDTTDFLFSAFAVDGIEPTNRISKITFNDLPDANTFPNGQVAYLDDAKVPVIASNCSWIGFDGRTVGTFFENQLWAWGNGQVGKLGNGTATSRCSPVREICNASNWCQVSAGSSITTAIKTSGELWVWGGGNCGQLGDGTVTAKCSPVREFCSATNWCQVSITCDHVSAIKTSGELWVWGTNPFGQLGDGTITTRLSPVREFCSATDWCQVSTGKLHSAAVKTSGELWGWGSNNPGAMGDGSALTARCSPVREICSATDWCQVSTGICNTAAVKTSGQLWMWGLNLCGGLGDGTTTDRCSPVREFCSATDWCQVSTNNGSIAIKTSGELWGWGRNLCGSVGDGTTINKCSPVREICSATNWCQVCAGYNHTFAIKTSGQLWAWGNNSCGKLGDGTCTIDKCSPVREVSSSSVWCQVSVGINHTAAIKVTTCICR
jgi:alpha-tubulin suppressor-like RCC1 family protein